MKAVAIFYYSLTGNTAAAARAVADALPAGCEPHLIRVIPTDPRWQLEVPFVPMWRTFLGTVWPTSRGEHVAITTEPAEWPASDGVVVGSSTWWNRPCLPIQSLLRSERFQGYIKDKPVGLLAACRGWYSNNLEELARAVIAAGARVVARESFAFTGSFLRTFLAFFALLKFGTPQKRWLGLDLAPYGFLPETLAKAKGFTARFVQGAASGAPEELMANIAQTTFNRRNLVLLAAILVGGGAVLFAEGYAGRISLAFALYGAAMVVAAAYFAAFEVTTRRLVLLAVIAGAGGYLTQIVGATQGAFWSYGLPHHTYYFVPFTFMLASLVAYGLTQTVIGSLARKVFPRPSRAVNPFIVLAVFGVLVWLSGGARPRGDGFWLYYGAIAAISVYLSLRMNTATLVSLLGSGALVGAAAELAGSRTGLWTFTGPGGLPPAWLLLGSWPLEVLVHYGLSGVLAREALVARVRFFREPRLYHHRTDHPMWCGERPHRVVSVFGDDKIALLDDALDRADLIGALERRLAATGRSREALAIVIKPNFMFMYSEHDRSTFTDPELVEHLVDWLRARGFVNLTVVEAQSAYGNYFFDRGVRHVAEVVGYQPRERYRIVDLTEEMVPHHFDGPLGDHFVGPTWRDAEFRISFAKNKTHTWAWYTLCLKNIYGTLPLQNKILEYHNKREIYYPTIDTLIAFPVHFGVVDAFVGADGPFGIFADKDPNPTHTVIAGENILAVDWVGASKMGLDPMVSRYMQLAVQVFGRPTVDLVGDGSVYPNWRNVPRPVIELWDNAEECYGFTNTVFSLLNHEYVSPAFPRRPVSRLYRWVSRLVAPIGGVVYQSPPVPPTPHPHRSAIAAAPHVPRPPRPSPSPSSSTSQDPASPPPGGGAA